MHPPGASFASTLHAINNCTVPSHRALGPRAFGALGHLSADGPGFRRPVEAVVGAALLRSHWPTAVSSSPNLASMTKECRRSAVDSQSALR